MVAINNHHGVGEVGGGEGGDKAGEGKMRIDKA